jgi:hypothetical protein
VNIGSYLGWIYMIRFFQMTGIAWLAVFSGGVLFAGDASSGTGSSARAGDCGESGLVVSEEVRGVSNVLSAAGSLM